MPGAGGQSPGTSQSPPPGPNDGAQAVYYPQGMDVVNSYVLEPGVCILPLAIQPPTNPQDLATFSPVVKLQLHAPYRIRRADYAAVKQNNPPVMPAPQDAGLFSFVGGSLTFKAVMNATLSNYDWAVGASYYFVENCVSRVEDGFVLGTPPWIYDTTAENANTAGNAPQIGAISQAGTDALIGFNQAPQPSTVTSGNWTYTSYSFFPGTLFDSQIVNN